MKALITGSSKSGTSLLYAYIKRLEKYDFSNNIEDKEFFNYDKLPDNYATKLVTDNKDFTIPNLKKVLDREESLKVYFILRHPIDCGISIVNAGMPPYIAIEALYYNLAIFHFLVEHYNDRLILIKMEEIILKNEDFCRYICKLLRVPMSTYIKYSYKELNNKYNKLDKYQAYKYRKYNNQSLVNKLKLKLKPMIENLGYKI